MTIKNNSEILRILSYPLAMLPSIIEVCFDAPYEPLGQRRMWYANLVFMKKDDYYYVLKNRIGQNNLTVTPETMKALIIETAKKIVRYRTGCRSEPIILGSEEWEGKDEKENIGDDIGNFYHWNNQ